MPRSRTRCTLLVALGLLAVPAAASASTATITAGDLEVTAAAAETNVVTVALAGDTITVTDTAGIIAGAGCTLASATSVTCPEADVTDDIVVALADGNDSVAFAGLTARFNGDVVVSGGAGNDLAGARDRTPGEIQCGAGRDRATIDGGGRGDRVAPDCESVPGASADVSRGIAETIPLDRHCQGGRREPAALGRCRRRPEQHLEIEPDRPNDLPPDRRRSPQAEVGLDQLRGPVERVGSHEELSRADDEEVGDVEGRGAADQHPDALLGEERRDHLGLDEVAGAGQPAQPVALAYQAPSPASSSSSEAAARISIASSTLSEGTSTRHGPSPTGPGSDAFRTLELRLDARLGEAGLDLVGLGDVRRDDHGDLHAGTSRVRVSRWLHHTRSRARHHASVGAPTGRSGSRPPPRSSSGSPRSGRGSTMRSRSRGTTVASKMARAASRTARGG